MTDTIAAAPAIPLLDPSPRRLGPVSRILLLRLVMGMALLQVIGAALTFGIATPSARAVGLSLTLPGGGLLYTGHPILFLAWAALLVVALVLWWGASFHLAIPAVWGLGILASWALVDAPRPLLERGTTWDWTVPLVYALAVALPGVATWKLEKRFRAKRAKVAELNEYLGSVDLPEVRAAARTPNVMDAELLRWCYDLAHQPDDGLAGLDWGEQLHGGTQLRYQLNAYSWALSLYAANSLPNCPGQIEEALSKVILKHTDLRVWGYWRLLNLLGNLDPNPDPIVRDNIMFSAFLGDVLNTFEAATGSTRFDEPGSLTFVWKDGRTFPYDHHSIVDAVRRNYERSRLGFFPCEPGWSFTVCNIMGAQSMHGHDVLHGTDTWDQHRDRWTRTLEEEYLTPDGTYAHIRSNHIGISWDTGEVPGGHYNANGTGRFADILPADGRRARALDLRHAAGISALGGLVQDGVLAVDLPEEPERHRTRKNALPGWSKVIGGSRMVGDDALAEAAIRGAERQCATGKRWPECPMGVSGAALGQHLIVRWTGPLGLADLHVRGYVPPTGPVLAAPSLDEALVVLARSPDGESLDLQLVGEGPVALRFEQLQPAGRYQIGDAELVADVDGRSEATVTLSGITALTLEVAS